MTAALTLSQHFTELDRLLTELRPYWQLRSFAHRALPWPDTALQSWLVKLSSHQRQQLLDDDALRAEALSDFIPQAFQLRLLSQIDKANASPSTAPPNRFSDHIPGRKWSQIRAFDQALNDSGLPFVEWCAGKGHLGRLLAFQHQRPVLSLELQPALCEHGQQLADKHQLPCRHQAIDVMTQAAAERLHPPQHAVALHACGKLHMQLLQAGTDRGVGSFSLSPCCYHLIDQAHYPAMSQAGLASELHLSRDDLKLAVQETVTAGNRERRLRQQQLSWRLGFDLLQRQLRGIDRYLNCPTIPQSRLKGSFADFCRWMAERKQLNIPTNIDLTEFERQGLERIAQVEQIELVRLLFRRPLEIWLVLDRALFLQQQGYRVQLQQFCDRQLTPRNLLIQAHKIAPSA
ncbi:MAG: methyltransferase [Halopseudomonas sp.]